MRIAAMAAAVSAISALRLISGGAGFSGAWAVATFSVWILRVGAELLVALGVAFVAIAGDTAAVKARGLATRDCDRATGALLAGLLWRPTE
jgi:hypothetical protein